MSGLFHSLLSKKHAEPECLTAQGIAARLERMFSEAASYIIIVSPYIKLNLRLRDILGEKKKAGVDITIIHKGPFTATDIATRHFQRSNFIYHIRFSHFLPLFPDKNSIVSVVLR